MADLAADFADITATSMSFEIPTLDATQSSELAAATANPEAGANLQWEGLSNIHNMSSVTFAQYSYALNWSETGCYRPGALPVALALNDTCLDGFFCEFSTDDKPPHFCPPYEICQVIRANKGTCDVQGVYEPKVCDRGRYCPRGGKEKVVCPPGHFCPTGMVEPFECSWGAICNEGSVKQLQIVPLTLTVIIDVALAIVVAVGFGISKWRKSRPKKYTTLDGAQSTATENAASIVAARSSFVRPRGSNARLSVSPAISPAAGSSTTQVGAESATPSSLSRPSSTQLAHSPPPPVAQPQRGATHLRRTSGRVDNMDGYVDDELTTLFEDDSDIEEDFATSPDFLRFIRSMSKTIETQSIGLSFDFENLGYQTRKGKKLLHEVTGTIPTGSCWGIMGGSGAGKSTFMNVLMGKIHSTSGSIKINGWPKDMKKYKKLIGYVPQDDIVFPELTVRENILHSARIRLPSSWKDKAIQDHVDSLIACLHLTHVRHQRVGDARKPVISGGQRKRVNIGIELAAAPMAIFLDEPTSGLDATSAASIMRLLRAISRLGVTTIAIIHQPREQIFLGFDQLLLLAQGTSVYSGPTSDVQTYFEGLGYAFPARANPADTIIDIITGDGNQYAVGPREKMPDVATIIGEWKKRGKYARHSKKLSTDGLLNGQKRDRRTSNLSLNTTSEQEEYLRRTMKARGATWLAQVFHCWKRAMTQQVRNASSFFFEIGVGGLAGIIIGLSAFASEGHLFQGIYHPPFTLLSSAVDYQSTPQLGLLSAMAIGLAASAPGFWVFGEEKLIYWRETASGHSRSAYYVGKLLSTLLRLGLSSLHFTVFVGVLATPLISFEHMYIANLMYFWSIYGLASVVSMFVKRENGPLIAVLASLILGILGGVAPPLSKVKTWHMEWFWRLSPGVWYTEAYFTDNVTPLAHLYELEAASELVGFTLRQYAMDVGVMFAIGLVYRIIAYFGLVLVHRDKQR